jgi:phage tail sheath protein FI
MIPEYIKQEAGKILYSYAGEVNDEVTRSRITLQLAGLFRSLKEADMIERFSVYCNKENNTPDVIDEHAVVVDIRIQFPESPDHIDFQAKFEVKGVDFSELTSGE